MVLRTTIKRKTVDLFREIMSALAPPPNLSVSEWANEYRYIPAEGAAEPGKWRNARVPHLVEIMNAMGDAAVPRVVAMLPSQHGKSEACINTIGRHIHLDQCPMLMVQPTDGDGKNFSKERIAPSIRDTPVLRDRVASPKTRDGDNTISMKYFPGGFFAIVGANAPSGLAARPIRVVFADEVDRYPQSAGTEGDPVSLAEKRTTTFWNRKLVMTSTPGDEETSRIAPAFRESTMEEWCLPCPFCGEYQAMIWGNLVYKGRLSPVYCCIKCGQHSGEQEWKSGKGKWIAEHPERKTRGFHMTALASVFIGWSMLVDEWRKANRELEKGNFELLKTFINTRLAETWVQPSQRVDDQEAMRLMEPYVFTLPDGTQRTCEVPEGVLILTAGVDVQENRVEVEVVGWGPEWESWGIEYRIIYGDTSSPDLWKSLDEFLLKQWYYGDGTAIGITITCIDSGYNATDVYKFTKPRESRRVYAIKGQGGEGVPMVARASKNTRNKAMLFMIGVNEIKGKIMAGLKVQMPGPGYSHFPRFGDIEKTARCGYTEEYFEGLVSERRVIKFEKGFKRYEWVKASGVRNEALDCRVYARAALGILNPDFERLKRFRASVRQPVSGQTKALATPVRRRRGSRGISV